MQLVLQAERNSVEDTNAVAAQEDIFLEMPPLHYTSAALFLTTLGPTAITWQLSGGTTRTWEPQRFHGILFCCKMKQLRFAEAVLLQLNSKSTLKLRGQFLLWRSRADHLTFFKAKEAVWPPRTSLTGILLRWMDLTAIGRKLPRGSGPSSRVSFSLIRPLSVVPDTTVPTPYAKESKTIIGVTQSC